MDGTFNLAVRLSGLLHYVENTNRDRNVRLCIVLPDAPNHRAVIRGLSGCRLTDNGEVVRSGEFTGKRVGFLFTQIEAGESEFDFEGPVMSGTPKGAVPLEVMIGDRADRHLGIVGTSGLSENHVRAQILVNKETTFSLPELSSLPALELPSGEILPMAPFVIMEIQSLQSARIALMPLDPASPEPTRFLDIEPLGEGAANLSISHFCPPPPLGEFQLQDEDFRFHYDLLESGPGERPLLGLQGEPQFPVPTIVKFVEDSVPPLAFSAFAAEPAELAGFFDPAELAFEFRFSLFDFVQGGCNCSPARGLARLFDLDESLRGIS